MNINQVKYFVAAYEQGSISTAARTQNVTAQAVSKAIGDLEKECGEKLFNRTNHGMNPHGVNPTAFGRAFYQKARVAAKAYTELELLSCRRVARVRLVQRLHPHHVQEARPGHEHQPHPSG